jgi:hypothetical protein
MRNLLNNHLQFKEKYLSLHKTSNVNPKNFNKLLKTKIKNLYNFSYNLNKFSKNNPTLIFKGLPFLTKGFSIKQTENILKLSPLSQKGLETLSKKQNLAYSNSKSPKTLLVNHTRSNTLHLNSKTVLTTRAFTTLSRSCLILFKDVSNMGWADKKDIERPRTYSVRSNASMTKGNNRTSKNIPNLLKKNVSLRNWDAVWSQKKTKYSNRGIYKPQISDKNWFSLLEEIRQIIKSKYVFNAFLASSQSVTYNFNKNFKKIDLNSVYKILKYFFISLSSLISKPVFLFSPDKINIRFFYFVIPSFSKLKTERKVKKLIRNKGKLYEEKKHKREFRKIMKKFQMKLFIARWKESNNLIRIPNLSDTLSKFISSSNQFKIISILPEKFASTPLLANTDNISPILSLNTIENTRTANTLQIQDRHLESVDLKKEMVSVNQLATVSLTGTKGGTEVFNNGTVLPSPFLNDRTGQEKSLQSLKNINISTMVSLNKDKLKYLVFILERVFNKTVILDLVRLKYPYHDSNILSQVLGLSTKRKNFRKMMRKLLYTATIKNPTKMIRKQNFSIIPSYLSGIKIRLAGRLITQRVVPRFTVQSVQMGSLARGKINYIDSSRFTHKNKRGAFSFTVTTSHIFENYK